jgi:hypothetical protein
VVTGVVTQRPSLDEPQQQQGKSTAAGNVQRAALRLNIAERGSGRTRNGEKSFSLEYSILLRIIIPNTKERK